MITKISSFDEYSDLLSELANDPKYYDPHFSFDKNNLFGCLQRKDEHAFAVLKDGMAEGVFVFLIIPDEKYAEMLTGFTKSEEAFAEMLSYLENEYPSFKADFVINPENPALRSVLESKNALFDPEQQRMLHNGTIPDVSADGIEFYSKKWEKQYRSLHRSDTYWNADRVLSSPNKFRVILAASGDELLGYLDVTCAFEENEPYDMFVKAKAKNRGYELGMICKALEQNKPNRMAVITDVDSDEAGIYAAAGFEKQNNQNSIFAEYTF